MTDWSLKNAALRLSPGALRGREVTPRKTFLAAGVLLCDGPRPHILDHHRIPLTSAKPSAIACELTVCSGLADDCSRCQEIDAALTANPDRPLRVYRRGALALKVRSIREGARLTVKIAGNGTPIFTLDYPCKGAAAPLARSKPDFDLRCQVSKNSLRAEGATVTVAARAQGSGSRLGAAPRSEFALQR